MTELRSFTLILSLCVFLPVQTLANCDEWFKKAAILPNTDCLSKCASLPVSIGTFECPSLCSDLCKSPAKEKYLFKLSDLYPGLTAAEKALAAKYPSKILLAYRQSWRAEELCSKQFPYSDTNDGSDACRHFVWACLLTKEFGREFAQEILDAHEQEPSQPSDQKAMDLANNQRGVTFAAKDPKPLSDDEIIREFKKLVGEGKLVILKKGVGQ